MMQGASGRSGLRLAIDTNCLIAALTKRDGSSAAIVDAWLDGRVEAVASAATDREFLSQRGYDAVEFVTPDEMLDRVSEALASSHRPRPPPS
jgi:predicted nucleic acid-binding protein